MKIPITANHVKVRPHSKKWHAEQKLIKFGMKHTKKKFRRKLIKLGLDLCPDCKGERLVKRKIERLGSLRTRKSVCLKCGCKGFVDWLSRITGRCNK